MSYETDKDYDVRWDDGRVTTVDSFGVLLRTLAAFPDASPEWRELSESETLAVKSIIQARTAIPPSEPQHQIQVRHLPNGAVAMTWTNGVTFRTAHLTELEAHEIAAELVRKPGAIPS